MNNPLRSPNANKIKLVHADAATFLEGAPENSFDGFSLSNILDGADKVYRERLIKAVIRSAKKDATLVIRSFRETPLYAEENITQLDRSFLWEFVGLYKVENLKSKL